MNRPGLCYCAASYFEPGAGSRRPAHTGSRAIALGGELYLKQNTYRTTAVYARGNLSYDLYGLGSGDAQQKMLLKQTGRLVFGEVLRRTGVEILPGR